MDINCLALWVGESSSASRLVFLPVTALCSHSCTATSTRSLEQAGLWVTRAKTSLLPGTEVTLSYTDAMQGRLKRRVALNLGWRFW